MMFSKFRYISLDYLNQMSGGNQDTQKQLLEMLIKELPQAISEMQQLFAAQNWIALRNASHKMKSTLAFVGNDPMTKANKKSLETLSNPEEGAMLNQQMKSLQGLAPNGLKQQKKVYNQF